MKLREFRESLKTLGYTTFADSYNVEVRSTKRPRRACAVISLREVASFWINTQHVSDKATCPELIKLVAEFTNTLLTDRNEKVLAKHANGSYVKEVTLLMMGEPALKVEMTNDYDEANDSISACERDWLDDFFGDKISYIEEY